MFASRSRRRRGFTLVEVLLVLVILVILASLVTGTYTAAQRTAQKNSAKAQVGLLKGPIEMYQLNMSDYPTSEEGLEALRQAPSGSGSSKWDGPYLEGRIPVDPWDNPYQYQSPGKNNPHSYDIWSFGPDRSDGTDDDIGNWEQE